MSNVQIDSRSRKPGMMISQTQRASVFAIYVEEICGIAITTIITRAANELAA